MTGTGGPDLPLADQLRLDAACNAFESAWAAGQRPRAEEFVPADAGPELRSALARELALIDADYRARAGDSPPADDESRRLDFRTVCLGADDSTPGGPAAAGDADLPPGFELLGELGRGGMGVVYKARERAVGRVVALKMIRTAGPTTPLEQARFQLEVELAARVRHPHVVTVYGAATHRGRPFVVLEYVEGGTLRDRRPGSPAAAARLMAVVAEAVQALHGQGIVHRDLKPSNVLLTADGAPKIADFGLAKLAAGADAAAAGLTATGHVLGTPAYMAPEQASGVRNVGPEADVHALGAILFELLTGRAPFAGSSVLEVLDQVRSAEPPSLRGLNPAVPRDLDVICRKCLAKDPARRYATAGELAADLRRHLDGRPITARPAGRAERAWRWVRRNRAAAGLAAASLALLATLAVGGPLAAYRQGQLRRAADVARSEAEANAKAADTARAEAETNAKAADEARAKSEASLKLAQTAADKVVLAIASENRLRQAGFHDLRLALLKTAVPLYEALGRETGNDPTVRVARGQAHWRLGYLYDEIGQHPASVKAYAAAADISRGLVAEYPDQPVYRQHLAKSVSSLAMQYRVIGDAKGSRRTFEESVVLLRTIIERDPKNALYRADLGRTLNNLARLLMEDGDPKAAGAALDEALAVTERLAAEFPDDLNHGRELGWVLETRSMCQIAAGDYPAARVTLDRTAKLFADLARRDPKEPLFPRAQARAWNDLGEVECRGGNYAAALACQKKANALYAPLVAANRRLMSLRHEWCNVLLSLARCQSAVPAEAAAARATARQAAAEAQALAGDAPAVPNYVLTWSDALDFQAQLLVVVGDLAAARAAAEKARDIREKLVKTPSAASEFRRAVADSRALLALVLRAEGKPAEAEPLADQAVGLYDAVLREPGVDVGVRAMRTEALAVRAAARTELKRSAEAEADWAAVWKDVPADQAAPFLTRYADALAAAGDWPRATAAADRAAAHARADAGDTYEAAAVYARAAAVSAEHQGRAVALLRAAVAKGFADLERLEADRRLAALRGTAEYRQIVQARPAEK